MTVADQESTMKNAASSANRLGQPVLRAARPDSEVADGEDQHGEEGDRRDARGLGEKVQRAALESDEREAKHGDHGGSAARDTAGAGGNPE